MTSSGTSRISMSVMVTSPVISHDIAARRRVGRSDYWFEDEWTAWLRAYRAGKVAALTRVDRDGDPDDLVDAAEAARMLSYSSRYVIHANRRLGYFPEPDAHGPARRGRPVPLWRRSTVWAAADRRIGPDGGPLPCTPRAPRPPPAAAPRRRPRPLPGLKAGEPLTTIGRGGEWEVSRRTAARIL